MKILLQARFSRREQVPPARRFLFIREKNAHLPILIVLLLTVITAPAVAAELVDVDYKALVSRSDLIYLRPASRRGHRTHWEPPFLVERPTSLKSSKRLPRGWVLYTLMACRCPILTGSTCCQMNFLPSHLR